MDLSFEAPYWQSGYQHIAGVDEAGRGCLAGPVVAAAVILSPEQTISGIKDSKQLSAKKREELYDLIYDQAAAVSVGVISPQDIDKINILQASLRAMEQALISLDIKPDYVLIDGNQLIQTEIKQACIVKGDSRCCSIAAASIIAKVYRDRLMYEYHAEYPEYGFEQHKGYPTKIHKQAIQQHGPTNIHRMTFHGVC